MVFAMTHSPILTPFVERYGKPGGGEWFADKNASPDLLAIARCGGDKGWFDVGGWEIAVGGEADARKQLGACGAQETSDRYAHAAMIGNDVGALTAVVLWNDHEPECVYVLDAEYQAATPQGPLGVWLGRLACGEKSDQELREEVGVFTELLDGEAPPLVQTLEPAPEIAAKLKGGGHDAYVEVGGCPVSVHKKGIRAWIDGKKKSKGLGKGAHHGFDVAGGSVFRTEGLTAKDMTLTRATVPALEVIHEVVGQRLRKPVALSEDVVLLQLDDGWLRVYAMNDKGDQLVQRAELHAGSKSPFVQGSRTGYVTLTQHREADAVLLRWTGERLETVAAWPGSGGKIIDVDGELYGTRYTQERGWHDVRMKLRR